MNKSVMLLGLAGAALLAAPGAAAKSLGAGLVCLAGVALCWGRASRERERREGVNRERERMAFEAWRKGEMAAALPAAGAPRALSWPLGLGCALLAVSAFFVLASVGLALK